MEQTSPGSWRLNYLRELFAQVRVSQSSHLIPTMLLSKTPKQDTIKQVYTYLTFAIEIESKIDISNYRAPLQLLPV